MSHATTTLLTSLGLPIVVVDRTLAIRYVTPAASPLADLTAADVGRSLREVTWNVEVAGLEEAVRACIDRATSTVRDVHDHAGAWYTLAIRPYRTGDGQNDGAIIVLFDLHTTLRSFVGHEQPAREELDYQQAVVELLADATSIGEGAAVLIETICRRVGWEAGELWVEDPQRGVLQLAGRWPPERAATPIKRRHGMTSWLGAEGVRLARSVLTSGKSIERVRSGRRAAGRDWSSAFASPIVRGPKTTGALLLLTTAAVPMSAPAGATIERLGHHVGAWIQCKMVEQALRAREHEYRELTGQLLRLQDEERRRLARDLHDSTAQRLSALIINLDLFAHRAKRLSAESQLALAESRALAEQCSTEVRTLTYLLHPPLVDEKGVASAIGWYASGFSKRSGVEVTTDVDDVGRLPRRVEDTLYRIVQESLLTVHRHADRPTAAISLKKNGGLVTLTVHDGGRGVRDREGFDAADGRGADPGIIRSLRERVEDIGGTFEVHSGPAGTTVRAQVPVHAARNASPSPPDRGEL